MSTCVMGMLLTIWSVYFYMKILACNGGGYRQLLEGAALCLPQHQLHYWTKMLRGELTLSER